MNTVYVALSYVLQNGMPVLDLALANFQCDKTKIVLTFIDGHGEIQKFMDLANKHYLPRCAAKKFQAQVVTPQKGHLKPSVLDLINRHGMKNFVVDVYWKSEVSAIFDETIQLSCKIWLVDYLRKLIFPRTYGSDPDLQKALMEAENFKKIANEETTKRQAFEQKLLLMTEQARINKKEEKPLLGRSCS